MIGRRWMIAALAAGGLTAGFGISRWQREGIAFFSSGSSGDASSDPLRGPDGAPVAGSHLPDFEFTDQHGKAHRFSDFRDRPRLVNFWATWCPPCVHEIPILISMQREYRERGLQIIGIASDRKDEAFPMALEFDLNYPTMADLGRSIDLLRAFESPSGGLPFSVFIDAENEVRDRHTGDLSRAQAKEKIEALFV
ncbi:MAG: TlpA family protein disulfide reductase [Ectothiorhodospiraceae bacterium AqS1]|nr:TlpA family protein disulfide reductase [Ectothiorhodospiraceae bacterium AqS1]